MKKWLYCVTAAIAILTFLSTGAFAQLPLPSYGINLGNTMEPPNGPGTWGPPATKALIDSFKANGFNTIRIPCAWHCNADANGNISATYMSQVQQVVDWCIADGFYVIINDHWDNGWFENNAFSAYDPTLNSTLQNLWTQVASHFASYDSHLLFACANEPNAYNQSQTNILFQYYQNWVPTIRNLGGNNATRWLILQGTSDYITSAIWPNDPAKHLMYEVHDYDPYQFTAMSSDASWGPMFYFWGAQYHVATGPTNRNASWGEESYMASSFATWKTKFANAGIPVLIGEGGAGPKSAEPDLTGKYITQNYNSVTYWNYTLHQNIASNGFYYTLWTTPGALFDWTTGACKDQTMLNSILGKSYVPPVPGLSYSSGIANGNHTLTPQNATGSRLDVPNSGGSGTYADIWQANGGSNQTWKFTNQGSGIYTINPSYNPGLCLDVWGKGTSNGTKVDVYACNGGSNQLWGVISDGGSIYEFAPQNAPASRLDVYHSGTRNGTAIVINGVSSSSSQKWVVN